MPVMEKMSTDPSLADPAGPPGAGVSRARSEAILVARIFVFSGLTW